MNETVSDLVQRIEALERTQAEHGQSIAGLSTYADDVPGMIVQQVDKRWTQNDRQQAQAAPVADTIVVDTMSAAGGWHTVGEIPSRREYTISREQPPAQPSEVLKPARGAQASKDGGPDAI